MLDTPDQYEMEKIIASITDFYNKSNQMKT